MAQKQPISIAKKKVLNWELASNEYQKILLLNIGRGLKACCPMEELNVLLSLALWNNLFASPLEIIEISPNHNLNKSYVGTHIHAY